MFLSSIKCVIVIRALLIRIHLVLAVHMVRILGVAN